MCGISGFVDYLNNTTLDVQHQMSNVMEHRGPDGFGVYTHKEPTFQLGLNHKRLSILELSELGKQPMRLNELVLTFNGEVYNYQEVRNELIELKHEFHSNSDTEVILHAYQEWGAECVHKFIGMFAIVIYDELNKSLFLCRDRAGVKPLYIYQYDNLILFASELKSFQEHPSFIKSINTNSLHDYFRLGYIPEGQCIFDHVTKLSPGHYKIINLVTKEEQLTKYWDVLDFYKKPKNSITEKQATEELDKLLTDAFSYRMVSDVPVGIFLSGGIDSSLVTSILQKNTQQRVKTFTIGFEDKKYNEANKAKLISEHLGTEHHEKYCSEKEAQEMLKILPFHFDEPFADTSALPTLLVSQLASKNVTVALSADAGDEIFAGYNSYDQLSRLSYVFKLPFLVRKSIGFLIPGRSAKLKKLKNILASAKSILHCHKLLNTKLDDTLIGELLKTDLANENSELEDYEGINNFLEQAMAMDYKNYMAGDVLCKVDRAGMAFSLEGREPLLDHRIIEYAAQLPIDLKYNKSNKKYLLKKILEKYLPKKLVEGPKKGFSVPIDSWLQKDFKPLSEKYLGESFIVKQGIFNFRTVKKMRDDFFAGKEKGANLWVLISFQLWYEGWMISQKSEE